MTAKTTHDHNWPLADSRYKLRYKQTVTAEQLTMCER